MEKSELFTAEHKKKIEEYVLSLLIKKQHIMTYTHATKGRNIVLCPIPPKERLKTEKGFIVKVTGLPHHLPKGGLNISIDVIGWGYPNDSLTEGRLILKDYLSIPDEIVYPKSAMPVLT